MSTPENATTATPGAPGSRTIEITERERQFLLHMLHGENIGVALKIYHAESHAVKELLKEREACAKRLLDQVETAEDRSLQHSAGAAAQPR